NNTWDLDSVEPEEEGAIDEEECKEACGNDTDCRAAAWNPCGPVLLPPCATRRSIEEIYDEDGKSRIDIIAEEIYGEENDEDGKSRIDIIAEEIYGEDDESIINELKKCNNRLNEKYEKINGIVSLMVYNMELLNNRVYNIYSNNIGNAGIIKQRARVHSYSCNCSECGEFDNNTFKCIYHANRICINCVCSCNRCGSTFCNCYKRECSLCKNTFCTSCLVYNKKNSFSICLPCLRK
ncbi:unnamed protein product, partial [marine sediment metagenome]